MKGMKFSRKFRWSEAGWGKITDGLEAGGFLQGAIAKETVEGWYGTFLESFTVPNAGLFGILIPCGKFLVGLGLILGLATVPALIAGAFMNLNFLLAGTTSTSPILYIVAVILLFAGSGAYFWGVDRFAVPY